MFYRQPSVTVILYIVLRMLDRCDSSDPGCGTLRQINTSRPGENVTLDFSPAKSLSDNPTHYVTYWINKTSNDYIAFKDYTLTIANVATWMQGREYYVQCTTGRTLDKCTQTVALEMKGKCMPTNT